MGDSVMIQKTTRKTPEVLVEMAVRNAGLGAERRASKWWHVSQALGLGSTTATALCLLFNVSPGEQLGGCPTCYDAAEQESQQ